MEMNANTRSDAILATQQGLSQQIAAQTAQLHDLAEWRPSLEARLANLTEVVAELQRARSAPSATKGGLAAAHLAATASPSEGAIHGQTGHGEQHLTGGFLPVNSGSPMVPPVTGTVSFQTPMSMNPADAALVSNQLMSTLGTASPAIHFPQFTGENPNLWKTLAEQYFTMFAIHDSYWVPMSTLHFTGAAGIWLQSVQKKLAGLDWISFTSFLCTRFGRDRHQLLIRQFYAIKQLTNVADYIEHFDVLMNHLVSYSDGTHPYYFLTRFVEGLRSDIRSVVMVQQPTDLDTAYSLALLQEEVTEAEPASLPRQTEYKYIKVPARGLSVTAPVIPSSLVTRASDHRGLDGAKHSGDDKLNALRAYRRAKGLYYKCGERWGREHTCPATVQLHIVEELLALFSQEEITGSETTEMNTVEPKIVCSISVHAMTGSSLDVPGVIQLHAFIEDHEVLILIDSGSSTSFLNK
uniref:Uncharacterized protein n=1 Tax=Avena sativa TaxID=4498 RepID=A0ACD5U5D8_AVESA